MLSVITGHVREQKSTFELNRSGKVNEKEKNGNSLIQQLRVDGDAQNITIVQQQKVSSSMLLRGKAGKERKRYHVMEKMLWDLLNALPDPKLKSFEKLVVAIVYESFENQKKAAEYL